MPIYEYVCTSCGKEFEAIQKFSDEPLTECECGDTGKVERKLSLSAFQLKGGGWYKDRYGAGKSNGSGNGSPASVAKAEGKSEGAPASKEGASSGKDSSPAACGPACACGA
jgi:putative FmdB family regulatory protein